MENFLTTVLPRPADTGGNAGQFPPNFVVLRKICFKRMIKQNYFPPKNLFCPTKRKWSKSFRKCWVWKRRKFVADASDESYEHENSKVAGSTGWTNDPATWSGVM